MGSQDFTEAMRERTNEELYEIVNFCEKDFVPEAIQAAKKEFNARNLSPASVSAIAESVKTKQDQRIKCEPTIIATR